MSNYRKFCLITCTKYCAACSQWKNFDTFNKSTTSVSGYVTYCKPCQSLYQKIRNSDSKVKNRLREIWVSKKYRETANARRRTKEGRAKRLKQELERRAKDPVYAVATRMRSLIKHFIEGYPGAFRYLTYTAKELKAHLESKFVKDMSWDNRQQWHVDHIIPLKYKNSDGTYYWNQQELADPTSETFQKCWSLNNLQPKWAKDNISKSNRYIG